MNQFFFKPGQRTYILSALGLMLAMLLQADAQDAINLAPMVKSAISLALTVIVPLVPVYIRKAIANAQHEAKRDRA